MISLCWAQYCCVNAHQLEWTPDYKNARETTDWAGMFLRAVVALLNAPAAQVPKHTDAPFRNRCTFSCAQLIDMVAAVAFGDRARRVPGRGSHAHKGFVLHLCDFS